MKNLRMRFRSHGKKGASAVEFALIFPIFMILIFALIDFGFYFYFESTLTHITRTTLRTAVTGKKTQDPFNPTNATGTNYLSRKQAMLKAAKDASVLPWINFRTPGYGTSSNFNSDLITFVTTTNNGTSYETNRDDLGGSGALIKMTFEQNFTFITPFVRLINPNNVTTNRIKISTTYKAEDFNIN